MSHDYFAQYMRALQLGGMSERTQEAYTRAVRMLVEFCGKSPEQIAEVELEEYFLHRRNVDKWSAATLRIAHAGVRFFFTHVLGRNWHFFTYLNAKRAQGLPCILDRDEVYRVLSCIRTFHNYACLATIYACGLRISEGLALQVSNIDPCPPRQRRQGPVCPLAPRDVSVAPPVLGKAPESRPHLPVCGQR